MNNDHVTPDAKKRLIAAAEEAFARKGFEAVSVREICTKANANIAAVNYHFGSKDRLYIEAVKHAHNCSTVGEPFPVWPDGTAPAVKLRDFIRVMVSRMHAPVNPHSLQLMMREMAHPTEAAKEVVRDYIQPMAFQLRQILRELQPSWPEERLLMSCFSVMGQILYYRQNRPVSILIFGPAQIETLTVEAVTDHVTRFTFAALGLTYEGSL